MRAGAFSGCRAGGRSTRMQRRRLVSTWLRDAGRGLQWMQGRWAQHTDAETKVGKHLEDASKSTEKAQKLAGASAASKKYTAALLQDAAQKARSAERSATFQRNRALQQMQQFQARQPTNYAPQMSL